MTLIQDLFDALGWEMIGPATRLVDALQLAKNEIFDAALLDINLNDSTGDRDALIQMGSAENSSSA